MGKTLYLEAFAGISGNMLLGALLDAGVPFDFLEREIGRLGLEDCHLICRKADKCGISGTYFDVETPESGFAGHHDHGHDGEDGPDHGHNHGYEHHHDHEEDEECGHEHGYDHHHGENHDHGHEDGGHHHHDHEHGHDHDRIHDHGHTHDHEHNHEHDHGHDDGHTHAHGTEAPATHVHVHRNLADIEAILDASTLKPAIIARAKEVFRTLGEAEAAVHGTTLDQIHFHEVGAVDTIVDIVGNLLALDYLGIERIFVSPVNTGHGFVRCAHGMMPVPAPATARLLCGIPHYRGSVAKEMTTPTGAALLKVLAEPVADVPAGFVAGIIGYGAGSRDLPIPNMLRASLGTCASGKEGDGTAVTAAVAEHREDGVRSETLLRLSCNLDDMSPELLPHVLERLLEAGALDAWYCPVLMKKGRPARELNVLLEERLRDAVMEIVFRETSTLGIREEKVLRHSLERRTENVETPWGPVRVKLGLYRGETVNVAPEYEDCRRLAEESGVPLKTVMAVALRRSGETGH